jgi:hypothetical protein
MENSLQTLTDAYGFMRSLGVDGFEEKALYLLHLADKRSLNRIGQTITGGELPIVESIEQSVKDATVDQRCPYGNLSRHDEEIIEEICDLYQDLTIDQLGEMIGSPARTLEDFFHGHEHGKLFIEEIRENKLIQELFCRK